MRRFLVNRWMALILTLALGVFSLAPPLNTAHAQIVFGEGSGDPQGSPGTPTSGSVGGVGDPDMPQNGLKQSSLQGGSTTRLSSSRTTVQPAGDGSISSVSWMVRFQWTFKVLLRTYLRY